MTRSSITPPEGGGGFTHHTRRGDRMNASRTRQFALVLALLAWARFADAAEEVGGLPRAGFFGAAITPLEDPRRERKLDPGVGVLVRMVAPASAAEEAGLKPDDII